MKQQRILTFLLIQELPGHMGMSVAMAVEAKVGGVR